MFETPETLTSICETIVLPNMQLREFDEEKFEDDFVEYRITEVTTVCHVFVNKYLETYEAERSKNWKAKDAALYSIMYLFAQISTAEAGATRTNEFIPILPVLQQQVLPDLDLPAEKAIRPIIKVDAIKCLILFHNQTGKKVVLKGILRELVMSDVDWTDGDRKHSILLPPTKSVQTLQRLKICAFALLVAEITLSRQEDSGLTDSTHLDDAWSAMKLLRATFEKLRKFELRVKRREWDEIAGVVQYADSVGAHVQVFERTADIVTRHPCPSGVVFLTVQTTLDAILKRDSEFDLTKCSQWFGVLVRIAGQQSRYSVWVVLQRVRRGVGRGKVLDGGGDPAMEDVDMLPPPEYATPSATKALHKELRVLLKVQQMVEEREKGWGDELVSGGAHGVRLCRWMVRLTHFEEGSPLQEDLKKFTVLGAKDSKTGAIAGESKTKYIDRLRGVTFSESWTAGIILDCQLELQETIANGLKLDINGSSLPAKGTKNARAGVEYKQDYIFTHASVDLFQKPYCRCDAVVWYESFLAGGEAAYDVADARVTRYNAAVGYVASIYFGG
ncbi:Mitochondrial porin [Rhizophlyctis rosea]|nr:Mitochondrial porin [Rhizophlyctis rosea]